MEYKEPVLNELAQCRSYLYREYYDEPVEIIEDTEIKNLVDSAVDLNAYMLFEMNPNKRALGYASPIIRAIWIDNTITGPEYAIVLTHEMVHIKHLTINERYTQFMTFKYLFECDNEFLNECAILFGLQVLNGMYDYNYDCSFYIIEYLLENVI